LYLLCDIGNTHIHFYHKGRIWHEAHKKVISISSGVDVFYISVSAKGEEKLLSLAPNAINLAPYMRLDTMYSGLGIDRVAACNAIEDGVIVDAGSAITLDIMQNGMHLGGYILPGLAAYEAAYRGVSQALAHSLNPSVSLDTLPQCTKDAISYGAVKSILVMIKNSSKSKNLYFTGGDGKFLSKFFDDSIYDSSIVFRGMQKTVEKLLEKQG